MENREKFQCSAILGADPFFLCSEDEAERQKACGYAVKSE